MWAWLPSAPQVRSWHWGLWVPVPELVGHGEGQRQARIFVDAAAAGGLAHAPHMGQAQGLTGLVHGCTQVLPAPVERRAFRLTWPGARPARARGPRRGARRAPAPPPPAPRRWAGTAALGTRVSLFTQAPLNTLWARGADPAQICHSPAEGEEPRVGFTSAASAQTGWSKTHTRVSVALVKSQ